MAWVGPISDLRLSNAPSRREARSSGLVQSVPYRQLGYEARGLVVLLMRSEEIVQTCCNALAVQFTPSSLFGHAIQIELLRNLVNIMLVGGAAASND